MRLSVAVYRKFVIFCVFATGVTGLIYQVVWQRYLAFLVGAEARSTSLVVAVFLLGLASGYWFWGNRTSKISGRQGLLKTYGFIEIAIGIYAILFPIFFGWLHKIIVPLPNTLAFDALAGFILIFPPTFLMGATIPMVTAALPERSDEVHRHHALIYGINTLGAFVGTYICGLVLIPYIGLWITLLGGGLVNISVGLALALNTLDGKVRKSTDPQQIKSRFDLKTIYGFVFLAGCISLSLEVLLTRIVGMTIGSGYYVFPIVVGVFVLGLAAGSLSFSRRPASVEGLFAELLRANVWLFIIYFTVPYWPYWMSNVRVSLTSIPTNYPVFLGLSALLLGLICLPLLISLGRLLPYAYALVPKTGANYGKVCGQMYFFNTLGTVVGAVFCGYLLLNWLQLEQVFKLQLILLLGLTSVLLWREGRHRLCGAALLAVVAAIAAPQWNRDLHMYGIFRERLPKFFHFQGLFTLPDYMNGHHALFYRDDPNSSVAVIQNDRDPKTIITVNGKSDGDTVGDFSTQVLLGTLPYVLGPSGNQLHAAVIGLGTGWSASVLGRASDVSQVKVVEMNPGVIEASPIFENAIGPILSNPKLSVVQSDAFRFFARTSKRFDIVVSEPSNPWVVGVENLFSREFYEMVQQALTADGVLVQWIQAYDMSNEFFRSIIDTALSTFPHAALYRVGTVDVALIVSKSPIRAQALESRMSEPAIAALHGRMGIRDAGVLPLLRLYGQNSLKAIAAKDVLGIQELEYPRLGFKANQDRFLGSAVEMDGLLEPLFARVLRTDSARYGAVEKLAGLSCDRNVWWSLCTSNSVLLELRAKLSDRDVYVALDAYHRLRELGLAPRDLQYIKRAETEFLRTTGAQVAGANPVLSMVLDEYVREGVASEGQHLVRALLETRQLSQDVAARMIQAIEARVALVRAAGT